MLLRNRTLTPTALSRTYCESIFVFALTAYKFQEVIRFAYCCRYQLTPSALRA